MSNETSLARQINSELAINKITIIDDKPISRLAADRERYYVYKKGSGYQVVEKGPSPHLSRVRLMHGLDALNDAIQIGYSALCFPQHSDVVREVALNAAVVNSQVLDWAISKSDKETDPLQSQIARNALKVISAVIEKGGVIGAVPMRVLLENNRDVIAKGAQRNPTWAWEYIRALQLTEQGVAGYSLPIWISETQTIEVNKLNLERR